MDERMRVERNLVWRKGKGIELTNKDMEKERILEKESRKNEEYVKKRKMQYTYNKVKRMKKWW